MTSVDGGGEMELFGGIFGLVGVEIDLPVIGAGGEKLARFRPTVGVIMISAACSLKIVSFYAP